MNQIATAILSTLCYSDIFNFPLTKNELYEKCITAQEIVPKKFLQELQRLVDNGQVKKTSSYYHLPRRAQCVNSRLLHKNYSEKKISKAKLVADRLMKLPYVTGVFVTGSVAVQNATINDDIDLMILTQPHSLWTTRLIVTFWLEWYRLRRRPGQQDVSDLFCANLYLTIDDLSVAENNRNLYTAYEIIQVKPLADPDNYYQKFIHENWWIRKYVAHWTPTLKSTNRSISLIAKIKKAPYWLEKLLFYLQLIYMAKRRTREQISLSHAYFHPNDLASLFVSDYNMKKAEMTNHN